MNRVLVLLTLTLFVPSAAAQPGKPKPDVADAKYGPHARNVLDLWRAKGDGPRPLVVFIHGGGFGGRAHEHPALLPFYGIKPDEVDTPKAHELFEKASPINYLTRDDPPVFLFYSEPKGPLPDDAKPGQGIHHPKFGEYLKEKMDPL